MGIVKVNISGTVFEVDSNIFTCNEDQRTLRGKFPNLITDAAKHGIGLTFQRPVSSFASILEYYQIGMLHMPNNVCPASFKNEMDFWEIEETELQACCRSKFRSFVEEQNLLTAFRQEIRRNDLSAVKTSIPGTTLRQRIWNTVDNRTTSIYAKIYFCVTILAVIASILGITLGTDPCCRREATICETFEYVSFTNKKLYKVFEKQVDMRHCKDYDFSNDNDIIFPETIYITEDKRNYFVTVYDKKDPDGSTKPPLDPKPSTEQPDDLYDYFFPARDDKGDQHTVSKQYLRVNVISIVEYVTLAFFTTDFLVRLLVCPSLLQFAKSLLNVIDLAALIGSYLSIVITSVNKQQKFETNWIDLLDFIQVFRALRLFRLVKNIRTSQVLSFSIRRNTKDMSMLFIFLMIFICTFGTLIYFTEDSSVVLSILDGWWWSIVTLTTVGYGDIVPETPLGRAVGSICAVTGIWLLSMTLPIFVNDFVLLHQCPYFPEGDSSNESPDEATYHSKPEIKHKAGHEFSRIDVSKTIQPIHDEPIRIAWVNQSGNVKESRGVNTSELLEITLEKIENT